jgi:hypothetical protein
MFIETGLTSIPSDLLPATTLATKCYNGMFQRCSYITSVPSGLLPATTLTDNCYTGMFYGCIGLTTIPSGLLPATTLTIQCYSNMFTDCINLVVNVESTPEYSIEFRIPTADIGTSASQSVFRMLYGTAGTMNSTPIINTTYYIKD